MFDSFRDAVKDFSEDVKSTVAEKELDEETLAPLTEKLRLKLLKSNVSLEAAEQIEEQVTERLAGEKVRRGRVEQAVDEAVEQVLLDILDDSFKLEEELEAAEEPPVVFLIGFNGSGKTTTAAKLARKLEENGRETVLGAGDTFRAASIEQLQEHGEALDVEVIAHEYESDPAAVAYDAVEHAGNEGKTAVVDTAGRSHSDTNLMDELEKMIRVNEPDVTFLVVDALAGNDVVEQAEAYEGMFDAVIVAKTDVDEKGGATVSIAKKSGKPVAYLGTGQDYSDLKEFDAEKFVAQLLD
ncbi:MAG: signal recognition particle receptor subunit alpha [Candidatus Nanohaloarchaea archaeon]